MEIKTLLKDVDNSMKFNSQRKMVRKFNNLFGKVAGSFEEYNHQDLEEIVEIISNSKKTDAYIARTLTSILQKSLKNGWYFECKDPKKAARIEKRFQKILLDSNMNPRSFLRDVLKNYIDYSNVFIYKSYRNKTKSGNDKVIDTLTLFPTKGWEVKSSSGPFITEWYFNTSLKRMDYTSEEVFHLHYNKEIHESFGTPFMLSVLEDVQILRDIEGSAIEDYTAQSKKKTIFSVGTDMVPGTSKEIEDLSMYLNEVTPEEDLVLSSRIKPVILQPNFTEPSVLMENMKGRVIAGLMASETQMGISGAGRQDADTQSTRELVTVEDFQENLEDQINNSLIRELCLEEFGRYDMDHCVSIKFGRDFDQSERERNHWLNLYNSGAIDFDEMRSKMELPLEDFKEEKSFNKQKLNEEKELLTINQKNAIELAKVNGSIAEKAAKVAAKNSASTSSTTTAKKTSTTKTATTKAANTTKQKATPTNQHGTKTSSKPSKKD